MNVLALCAGIGGLELGIKLAVPSAAVVCYVEREAYAAAILVERMGTLGLAPIWSDLATFDGKPWRGIVDCITAGYPCQPFSVAGARLGVEDERWIWPDVARIIREVSPGIVFLENVAAHLGSGFDRVLADLAALGFDAEWDCIPAASVGAPHIRDRVFIFAHAKSGSLWTREPRTDVSTDPNGCGLRNESIPERWGQGPAESLIDGQNRLSAYANGQRLETLRFHGVSDGALGDDADGCGGSRGGAALANTNRKGLEKWPEQHHAKRPASQRGSLETLANTEGERWGQDERGTGLAHDGGLPGCYWESSSAPEPAIRRMDDGVPNRVDRIRSLGNGVVPQAAARAFEHLRERAER